MFVTSLSVPGQHLKCSSKVGQKPLDQVLGVRQYIVNLENRIVFENIYHDSLISINIIRLNLENTTYFTKTV